MNRREFIRTGLAGAALAALPRNLWSADPAPVKRPNIVFVVADDMGWRDTGYQGSPNIKTPCLDALVANGVRFDYFYAAQQMCSPGRFGILTGRAPFRSGVYRLNPIRPQEITIAQSGTWVVRRRTRSGWGSIAPFTATTSTTTAPPSWLT